MRVKTGIIRRKRHKRVLKAAKGLEVHQEMLLNKLNKLLEKQWLMQQEIEKLIKEE